MSAAERAAGLIPKGTAGLIPKGTAGLTPKRVTALISRHSTREKCHPKRLR